MARRDVKAELATVAANSSLTTQPPSGEVWKIDFAGLSSGKSTPENGKAYAGLTDGTVEYGIAGPSNKNSPPVGGTGNNSADNHTNEIHVDYTYFFMGYNGQVSTRGFGFSGVQIK